MLINWVGTEIEGEIPNAIGELLALKGLNLSHIIDSSVIFPNPWET
jgi:hypothetical protein